MRNQALCFVLLCLFVVSAWADIYRLPTEPVELNNNDHKLITQALEELKSGLSNKVKLFSLKAERVKGKNKPAYFSYAYHDKSINRTYSRLLEVHCQEKLAKPTAWQCKHNGKAILFKTGNVKQTVWLQDKITFEQATRLIDFLKTKPPSKCIGLRLDKKPCEAIFDETNLKEIKLIRLSYSDKNTYVIGDHRKHPGQYYEIKPAICNSGDCSLAITGSGSIMY